MNDDTKSIPASTVVKPTVSAKLSEKSEKFDKVEKVAKPEKLEKLEKSEKQERSPDIEKKKRGRKPVFKPTQFDLDLLHLLREGTGNSVDLIGHLGVAESELVERIRLLKAENLVTEENGNFHLTVNGYNFYTTKWIKKVSLKKSFTGEVKFQKHRRQERREEAIAAPSQKHVNDFLSSTEVVDLGGKLGRMDLEEIIRRYGPTAEQRDRFIEQKVGEVTQKPQMSVQPQRPVQVERQPQVSSRSVEQQPRASESPVDVCDLCKSDFKLSMANADLAKYGHCFCGAAYHKECYDSLLGDSAKCIRCGKKLFLIIDKQSRDAMSKLKDAFE